MTTLACLPLLVSAVQAHASTSGELRGSFVAKEPLKRAQKIVKRAIDEGTSELSFIIRGLARSQLRSLNKVASGIDIGVDGGRIRVAFDRDRAFVSPNGVKKQIDTFDGEPVVLSQHYEGQRLVQRLSCDKGELLRIFSLHGDELQMAVTMTSDKLSRPIRYTLVYGRRDLLGTNEELRMP